MLRRIASSRQLRFAAVGVAITVFGFLILYLMVEIADVSPRYAKPVELAISIQLNYIGNRLLTWRDRRIRSEWHGVLRSNIVRIATAAAAWGIFVAFTELVGVPYLWASLVSIVLTVPVTYVLSHLWVYRDRPVTEPGRAGRGRASASSRAMAGRAAPFDAPPAQQPSIA